MASFQDRKAAREAAAARARIEAIYTNRGLPVPPNVDRQVERAVNSGGNYFDQIRKHAERESTTGFIGGAQPAKTPIIDRKPPAPKPAPPGGIDESKRPGATQPLDYREMARALMPWLPVDLLNIYADAWAEHGDAQVALGKVRQSPVYDSFFPGNRRENGSLRYSEQEYFAIREGMLDKLDDYGLNPALYESKIGNLIGGDVSPQEFGARVDALWERVVNATPEEKAAAAAEFGVGTMSDEAFLGIALDPDIGNEVLDRRISVSQITGRARRFGFQRSRDRIEELMNAGLDPEVARQFFGQAATAVPRLSAMASRFNEDPFGIGEFEEAFLFGDVEDQQTVSRLQSRERSLFSSASDVQQDQTGALVGLRRR